MKNMFTNQRINKTLYIIIIIVFIVTFSLLRTQAFIGDDAFMLAMIPHHSSAILKSEQASLSNPQVQELARQIITAQKEEITIMKRLIIGEDVSEILQNRTK